MKLENAGIQEGDTVRMSRIYSLIITNRNPLFSNRRIIYDNKAKSLFKKSCNDNGPIFQIGKSSMTPALTEAIGEALTAHEN